MLLTLTQQIKHFNKFKASPGSNMRQNSYIAWEGNSLIDGSPIVLILTGFVFPSFNKKTGSEMIQSWILQQEFVCDNNCHVSVMTSNS
jgi:hypothetical protein